MVIAFVNLRTYGTLFLSKLKLNNLGLNDPNVHNIMVLVIH